MRATYFTLVELLIIIAIIAILVALLLPSLSRAQKKSKQISCTNNQKQIGTAVLQYTSDHHDWMPIPHTYAYTGGSGDVLVVSGVNSQLVNAVWVHQTAGYLGSPEPFLGNPPKANAPAVYRCPAGKLENEYRRTDLDNRPGYTPHRGTNYAYTNRVGGKLSWGAWCIMKKITRCRMPGNCGIMIDYDDPAGMFNEITSEVPDTLRYLLRHDGINALFVDGHVEFIPLHLAMVPRNGFPPLGGWRKSSVPIW